MFHNATDWSTLVWSQIWQIALLGTIVAIANLFVGRRWPHLAYALWLVVLVKCFVPPLGPSGVIARLTPVAWFGADWANAPVEAHQIDAAAVRTSAANATFDAEFSGPARSANLDRSVPAGFHVRAANTFSRWATAVWLFGSVLLTGMAIGRGGEVGRRLRRTSRPVSGDVMEIVERVAARLALRHRFQVLVTASDAGPMVAGLWTPRVYIPQALIERLSTTELESMLVHELAHVRRRDTWVATLQFAARIVWWFHPVVWWMNREIVRQRERCCDEEVVANLNGQRGDYARCLVHVLEARHALEPLWGYPAVRPAELTRRRLEEIMKRENMNHRRAPLWCSLAAACVAIVALPGASEKASAQQSTDKSTAPASAQTGGATTPTQAARPAAAKSPNVLEYGDGEPDGKKSLGGSGEVIRFELPAGADAVAGIRIHGSRDGLPQAPKEDFEIIFVNEDFDEVLHTEKAPYELFRRGRELWVRINFKEPVTLPKKFWVVLDFHAEQTKGVYVSYDTSTKGQYSRIGLPSAEKKPKETDFGGDWMVQLFLKPPAAAGAAGAARKSPATPANR